MHGNHVEARGASGVVAMRGGRRDTGGMLKPLACQRRQCKDVPHKEFLVGRFAYESVWFTNRGANSQETCPVNEQ